MNISYRWLQSLVPSVEETPQALADRLAMLGAPVDELVELGAELGDVVIARVDAVRQHPNADRLRLCSVDAGGETLQVVCGAPNVEAGAFYPFAPIGASLPGGVAIRKAKLRGEVSEGMLCSPRELGLGRDHDGLMTLHGEWQPGASFVESLGLRDVRLAVDVTPNRPDLLSHVGIAREIAPNGVDDVTLPRFPNVPDFALEVQRSERQGEVGAIRITLDDADGCPRYLAAVVRGVRVGPSPEWLTSRLRAAGVRPINNVVDATNYVLFELGQPLHAFDLARLQSGEVRIRRAAQGEAIRTLDGQDRSLDAHTLVIADGRDPVAVAGVMGGENSEVSPETTELLLECALFDPRTVRRAARRLGLSTDASYRFERGVDPEVQPQALRRLVELVLAVAGGEAEPVALDLNPRPHTRLRLALRTERVERILGIALPNHTITELLGGIGFEVQANDSPLQVEVPGFRPDVTREVDLIEEVARRYGYNDFPEVLRAWRPGTVPDDPAVAVRRKVQEVMRSWGFLEAQTAAFGPASDRRVPLLYPLSAEESHLRDTLVPGLLRRLEHNWSHGNRDVRLFEIGTVFAPGASGAVPSEETRLAAVFTGDRRPPHWSGEPGTWDLWDLKGLLEELSRALRLGAVEPGDFAAVTAVTTRGERMRVVTASGEVLGGGGTAASDALDAPAWADPVLLLELVLPRALAERGATFQALPQYPAVERDLALLVPIAVSAAELREVVVARGGELLESLYPFDVYEGKGVPGGTRSVAWRLRFRRPERTLTDAEVDTALERILQALEEQLGVRRR
jgi:phenylalanyl-tRNA synthetase beta chain